MDAEQIDRTLAACEQALRNGEPIDLRALGFWRAVAAVKRNLAWTEVYGDRIAEIDRQAFERSVRLRFPLFVGLAALALGALVGLILAIVGLRPPHRKSGGLFVLGSLILIVTTHDLAHYAVGQALGIRFSQAFLGGKGLIEPGLKVDYASYLRAPAQSRALMHASGAVATKLVAILGFLVALLARLPARVSVLLAGIASLTILIDVFFSTRYSDWKRFSREIRVANALQQDFRR